MIRGSLGLLPMLGLLLALTALPLAAARAAGAPDPEREYTAYVVVFDFACDEGEYGKQLADSLRLRLRRHKDLFVLDRLASQDLSPPLPADTDVEGKRLKHLLLNRAGCNVAFLGTVRKSGDTITADIRCLDLTHPDQPGGWLQTFSDGTERARGVIARYAVETYTGAPEWVPPQYGDEKEPTREQLGEPLNVNGDFEDGHKGWDAPDNLGTFLEKGPEGRGMIHRARTDMPRDPWWEWRRKYRLNQADLSHPPTLPKDTSYGSVAGIEGVHFRSDWIRAEPGMRYWLMVDACKPGGTPKVFVKGFIDWSKKADGLPELSMVERGITPEQLVAMPAPERKALIAADAQQHPERYRRESYRWFLNLRGPDNTWQHHAAPFPPSGGLPENVQWFSIQIYSYWPPGNYLWDNCWLYKHPDVKQPLPEDPRLDPTENWERSKEQTTPDP